MNTTQAVEHIRKLDGQLLVAGERLARYRRTGPGTSVIVQTGVVNRLLDQRLVLMDVRDRAKVPSRSSP